ncbi:MAG: hypothetical protein ACYS3N_23935, partial [Planctomycetota bacterium]
MKSVEDIKRYFQKSTLSTNHDRHEAIFEKIQRAQDQSKTTIPALYRLNLRSNIMKSPITKLAAAAVIIIAVTISINQFGSPTTTVAWGEVVRNVEKIHTITFRETVTGPTEQTTISYSSLKYGLKEECYKNGQIYTIACYQRPERMLVAVRPLAKAYERRPLTEAELRGIDNRANARWVVKKFMSVEYKELGRSNINGVEVEGIEINSTEAFPEFLPSVDSFVGCLWVDVATDLPVLIELEFVPAGSTVQTKIVIDEIQWNVEFSKSNFEPNIPA